jgi:arylsulfatase A-like enzyme
MGLIKQVDDHMGRLFCFLEAQGRLEDTMIIFTSDHGDYLGDHYLGEKELFHDTVAKVPLIVYDPLSRDTRGTVEKHLVEAIDVVPTILEAFGVTPPEHQLEGLSLLPLLRGERVGEWRDVAVSEADYSFRSFVRDPLKRPINGCHNYMLRSDRWKYIYYDGLRPQLFDMQNDPNELADLGTDPAFAPVRAEFAERLFDWMCHRRIHTTVDNASIAEWTNREWKAGIRMGVW